MDGGIPLTREVVLIGGGHAHALLLKRWGMRPVPGARLTLVDPGPTAAYTGMLPGHVAGHYPRAALDIDLVRLARHAGARLILGRAEAIDRDRRRIRVAGRGEIAYDIASLDIGITSDMPELPGFSAHAVAAKPLDRFADAWDAHLRAPGAAIAVIGGGVGGVELAMAMAWRLRQRAPRIAVLDAATALPGVSRRARQILLRRLEAFGIDLMEHVSIAEVTADAVVLADGRRLPADFTVGSAGARPYPWLRDTGLDLTEGFVTVGPDLRSVTDPAIYAAGDCAHLSAAPRPKAGVFAVREAPVLCANIRADLLGEQRRRYRPQRDYLKLISLGRRDAVAERFGSAVAHPVLWRWKDRIDRRFMGKLGDLTPMPPQPLPRRVAAGVRAEVAGGKPMCGGCGAKVAGEPLARTLAALPAPNRADVLSRPGDDAAILGLGTVWQVLTTDHLRAFVADPWLMARIAAVHAMGDIWAMGAAPQAATATVILPRLSPSLQETWLAEIMQAAAETFAAEGAVVAGGHTSVGAELTIGFTVTGFCDRPPLTLAGARPGDALVLTKPLGSGTILAAEMVLKARGAEVAACWAEMTRPQGRAAESLRGARAMTDVTGFGLAGHLLAMCDASGVGARLLLADLPLMPGALRLAEAGVRSTLQPQNRAVAARMRLPEGPHAELLFDPQTSGGLLAAVPADAVGDVLSALAASGYPAARIGEITDGPPFLEIVG